MAKPSYGDIFDLSIDGIAFGGFGVAHENGNTFFVRMGYPPEKVRAKVFKRKRGVTFAEAIEVLEPAAFRRLPPCPVFGQCGGCSWQDIHYDNQFDFKKTTVLDSFRRIGHLDNTPDPIEIHAKSEFRYRNKMELTFGEDDYGRTFLGQHLRGRYDRLVPTGECLLMPEEGNRIIRAVEKAAIDSGLRPYNSRNDSGVLRNLMLRFSHTHGDYLAIVTVRKPIPRAVQDILEAAAKAAPLMSGGAMIVNQRTGGSSQGELEPMMGKGYITEEMLGIEFIISPTSFFQTNTVMAREFYGHIIDFAELAGDETVLDLYCGTGTIAQFFAKKAAHVIGLESVASAVEDGRKSAERNGISNVEFIAGTVEKTLSNIFDRYSPDILVMDPPRSGVSKKSLIEIMEQKPPVIIYASCNPTTLARDIEILSPLYSFDKLAIVDMFPQTYHIESITRLNLIT